MVFGSGIDVWQVPSDVYSKVSVSYAELDEKIGEAGPLGKYLIDQLHEWNATHHGEPIESRSLGDSPAVALMLYPQGGDLRTGRRRGSETTAATCPAPGNPSGLRVRRRPVPAGGHVRQDPPVRPASRPDRRDDDT